VQDLKLSKAAAGVVAGALVLAATPVAAAGDRLAVLVVVAGDPELSDNLTEVAIAKLALRRDRHLVGLREVRESLRDVLDKQGIGACVEQPACLSRLGAAARAESALIGDVRREAGSFAVRLALVDTQTAVRVAESTASVPADMKQLIAAIRTGVAALLEPRAPTTLAPDAAGQSDVRAARPAPRPVPTLDLRGDMSPPPPLSVLAREQTQRHQPRWLLGVGYGAGGAAVVALSAAAITGSMATATPTGANRAEMAAHLDRLEDYATAANALFIAGGVLALAAIATFVWSSSHD
jgi:hypothetical protein